MLEREEKQNVNHWRDGNRSFFTFLEKNVTQNVKLDLPFKDKKVKLCFGRVVFSLGEKSCFPTLARM